MKIDKDSYGTIAGLWFACIAITTVVWVMLPSSLDWLSIGVTVVAVAFMAFVTWFHRVPARKCHGRDGEVISVADGKVVIIKKTFEDEYFHDDCIQVSVYMSFFDVHANYWPISGTITYYKYHPGRYFLAFKPKASEENEHSSTVISTPQGQFMFRQIAGTFARRISCYSHEGRSVTVGRQCGIIKFGSRIDFFLPLTAKIEVSKGDRVHACKSVIARLQ